MDDTDGDHILDGDEGPGNATQIEGSDPEIVGDIEAEFVFEYGEILGIKYPRSMHIRVLVWVKDNAGIDWVEIECQGRSPKRIEYVPFIGGDPGRAIPVEANFQADFVGAFWSGYDIKVKVADVNGNGVSGKTHLDSVAEAVIKAILAALEAFVKAVVELASKVFDWIWDWIEGIFKPIFKPMINAITNYFKNVVQHVSEFLQSSINENPGRINSGEFEEARVFAVLEAILSPLLILLLILIGVLITVISTSVSKIPLGALILIGVFIFVIAIVTIIIVNNIYAPTDAVQLEEFQDYQSNVNNFESSWSVITGIIGITSSIYSILMKLGEGFGALAGDLFGLIVSIIGMLLSAIASFGFFSNDPLILQTIYFIGFILSLFGFIWTLRPDLMDGDLSNPMRFYEETLSGIGVGLSAMQFQRSGVFAF